MAGLGTRTYFSVGAFLCKNGTTVRLQTPFKIVELWSRPRKGGEIKSAIAIRFQNRVGNSLICFLSESLIFSKIMSDLLKKMSKSLVFCKQKSK